MATIHLNNENNLDIHMKQFKNFSEDLVCDDPIESNKSSRRISDRTKKTLVIHGYQEFHEDVHVEGRECSTCIGGKIGKIQQILILINHFAHKNKLDNAKFMRDYPRMHQGEVYLK